MIKDYKIVNEQWVEFIDGPYNGMVIKFGRVIFAPDLEEDQLTMKFEYDIIVGNQQSGEEFVNYLGNTLHDIIREKVARNEAVYTGGVDED